MAAQAGDPPGTRGLHRGGRPADALPVPRLERARPRPRVPWQTLLSLWGGELAGGPGREGVPERGGRRAGARAPREAVPSP